MSAMPKVVSVLVQCQLLWWMVAHMSLKFPFIGRLKIKEITKYNCKEPCVILSYGPQTKSNPPKLNSLYYLDYILEILSRLRN